MVSALILAFVAGQTGAPVDRVQGWRSDLEFLRNELPKRHVNAFFKITKDRFQTEISQLEEQVPKLSDVQVELGLSRIVASIGDPHTSVYLFDLKPVPLWLYPLSLACLRGNWYVVGAGAGMEKAVGCRVVAIGGVPIAEVVRRTEGLYSFDTEGWRDQGLGTLMVRPLLLQAEGVPASEKAGIYTLETLNGRQFDFTASLPPGKK